jgi:hypothetical protein
LTLSSKDQNVFCIVNCKEDYDHLKLACKPIFQKINTYTKKQVLKLRGNIEILIFILSVSGFTWYLMYRISSLSRLTYAPGIFPGILSKWYKLLISSWHWWNQICSWKVGTTNSGKEFSEITENNKSRKIKEFKSKAETALWFVESYGLEPQYLKLESTDGQTVKSRFQSVVQQIFIPRFAINC